MSSLLKKRSVFLGEVLLLISGIGIEIEFVSLPLYEILKKTESFDGCRSLDFISLCLSGLEKGEDFYPSWKQAVISSSLPLKKEERERLISLGGLLGTSDAHGQGSVLALYNDYFSFYHRKATEDYEKYGKMCVTLSVVAGVGFFILLM